MNTLAVLQEKVNESMQSMMPDKLNFPMVQQVQRHISRRCQGNKMGNIIDWTA